MFASWGVSGRCAIRAGTILDNASIALSCRDWWHLHPLTFLSAMPERAPSVKASASEDGVQRPKTFGAGLGWREARRRGLGTAIVPNGRKAAEPLPVQPRECSRAVNPRLASTP